MTDYMMMGERDLESKVKELEEENKRYKKYLKEEKESRQYASNRITELREENDRLKDQILSLVEDNTTLKQEISHEEVNVSLLLGIKKDLEKNVKLLNSFLVEQGLAEEYIQWRGE